MNTNNKNPISENKFYIGMVCGILALLVIFLILITVSTVMGNKEPEYEPPFKLTEETEEVTDTSGTANITDTTDTTGTTDTTATADTTYIVPADTAKPTSTVPSGDALLAETEDAGKEYINKLIFLGDSTTYGLKAYKMLEGGRDTKQVWTPKNGTLTLTQVSFATIVYPETGEEITIKEAVSRKKPEYLVITLGVNGVAIMDEDYFKSEYKKLIETVKEASPDTKVICQSIFPVARSYKNLDKINNEKITAANGWILGIAEECGVKYVDTYSALCDSEGWLPENYQNGDGMHLNEVSFAVELQNLRTHAYID